MAVTISYRMMQDKIEALKLQGLSEATIAIVVAGMGIEVRKTDIDVEREAVNALDDNKALEIMTWLSKVPYKSKWSFTLALYRRHWSFEKLEKTFKSDDGEVRIISDKIYCPTKGELLTSWSILKLQDKARSLYKDFAKDNSFALQGEEKYSKDVSLPNTRGGQVD